jgi:hypothetical protein
VTFCPSAGLRPTARIAYDAASTACGCSSWDRARNGAQHGRDRAAGAKARYLRVGWAAEEQGHRGLQKHCSEPAGEVEDQIAKLAERVLDVLAENRQKEHVAQDVIPAAMQEHRRNPANTPRVTHVAGIVDIACIKRGLLDRRLRIRQFVEHKDCEVGGDQRDINPGEPAGRNGIGLRDHAGRFRAERCTNVSEFSPTSTGVQECKDN